MVWHQSQLTVCEAVVTMHRCRDWVRYVEVGRVADERCSQIDAVVEEWRVVDGGDGHNDVAVGQVLARFPLDDALVRASHMHHLSYNQHRSSCSYSVASSQQYSVLAAAS